MQEKFRGNDTQNPDLAKVLLAVKENTMKSIHVATMAVIKSVENDIINVEPFPIVDGSNTKQIECISLSNGIAYTRGDIVLVLYTDLNGVRNLKQNKAGQKMTSINKKEIPHQETNGIIIGLIYKEGEK